MAFNIADFNSEIAKSGIASTSHFEAWIIGGLSPLLTSFGLSEGMRFRIESVNMPGRQLQTLDQNYYGPVRRIPFRASQQPVSLSVILSKDMREREVFMKWQDYFVGHYRTNTNRSNIPGMFDGKYFNDGICNLQIYQYSYPLSDDGSASASFEVQNVITLVEAYPVAVNDIQMSWGDEGYAKMQVEINYHYATEDNINFGGGGNFERERDKRVR